MDITQIIPVGSRVLLKPYEAATTSASGLVMQATSNTSVAPVRGTVVAVGSTSQFKIGQDLLFVRFSVYKCTIITSEGEKDFSLVEDCDVLALVTDGSKT